MPQHAVRLGQRRACGAQVVEDEAAFIHLREEIRSERLVGEIRARNEGTLP